MGCGASNDGRDKNEEKKKKSEAATGRPSEEKYLELKDSIERCINKNKADLVFKNGKIVNVFSGEILEQDLAIHNGKIIGCGDYEGFREINLEGKMVLPGFIDGHIHIESSMLSPYEFSKAVVPKVQIFKSIYYSCFLLLSLLLL
jgi:adenine deaminase